MSVKNTPETFWAKVHVGASDTCWEWRGATTSSGYGSLTWHGTHALAHRVAYRLAYGGIDLHTGFRQQGVAKAYRQFVLHACDNRLCCNPAHLFLGSMSDNLFDAYAKGRKTQPRSQHRNAKVSPTGVVEIRARYAAKTHTQAQLAAEFGISQRAVSMLVRRETYADI